MRSGGAENSNQEISTISRSPKALAKELSCPVLGCALLSAGNVTLIFLLRLAILLQARPLFVLTMTIGFVDGLVRRDLRRFGSGHESGFVYHHVKRMIGSSLAGMGFMWLTVPVFLEPRYIVIPGVMLIGFAGSVATGAFKKHL